MVDRNGLAFRPPVDVDIARQPVTNAALFQGGYFCAPSGLGSCHWYFPEGAGGSEVRHLFSKLAVRSTTHGERAASALLFARAKVATPRAGRSPWSLTCTRLTKMRRRACPIISKPSGCRSRRT